MKLVKRLERWKINKKIAPNFEPLKPLKESILHDLRNKRNILLIGGTGTGKTYFMKEIIKKYVREAHYIYHSADRDTAVELQRAIHDFSDIALGEPKKHWWSRWSRKIDGKFMFVDDLDHARDDTQLFIKSVMDGYGTKNIFVFAANSLTPISRAIQSRCVTYNFNVPDGRVKATQMSDEFRSAMDTYDRHVNESRKYPR